MQLALRYNEETDDVELVRGDYVVDTVGPEVVASWVTAYNKKHGYVERVKLEEELKNKEEESGETTDEAVTENSSTEEVDKQD